MTQLRAAWFAVAAARGLVVDEEEALLLLLLLGRALLALALEAAALA